MTDRSSLTHLSHLFSRGCLPAVGWVTVIGLGAVGDVGGNYALCAVVPSLMLGVYVGVYKK